MAEKRALKEKEELPKGPQPLRTIKERFSEYVNQVTTEFEYTYIRKGGMRGGVVVAAVCPIQHVEFLESLKVANTSEELLEVLRSGTQGEEKARLVDTQLFDEIAAIMADRPKDFFSVASMPGTQVSRDQDGVIKQINFGEDAKDGGLFKVGSLNLSGMADDHFLTGTIKTFSENTKFEIHLSNGTILKSDELTAVTKEGEISLHIMPVPIELPIDLARTKVKIVER
ncbi:MAG: hypothetical protein HQL69_12280 [Magnetococcales bacterium]|nr:hypothetical protein [Magnetococcales bacterium]